MRKSAAVLVVAGALAWAVPADADGTQAGCHAFGATVAATVQANIPAGQVASGIAQSGPGAVADFVEGGKLAFCP
jgi:hypothetical protein